MTPEEYAKKFANEFTNPGAGFDHYGTGEWDDYIIDGIAASIHDALDERDERWQRAIGMPLEQAERLAHAELPAPSPDTTASPSASRAPPG